MKSLEEKYIGVAADRNSNEIKSLIEKHGGKAFLKPIQGERWLEDKHAEEDVGILLDHDFDCAVFTTGIGAEALEKAATRMGKREEFIRKLKQINHVAIRGSKTLKCMNKWGIKPNIISPDGTMNGLIDVLQNHEGTFNKLFYQSYDQEEQNLLSKFNPISPSIYLSAPYHYLEPDPVVLEDLRFSITSEAVDAVLFTSKTQVFNLFNDVSHSQESLLIKAFNGRVLAVAVGQVTGDALRDKGIIEVLQPEREKMGAMVIEVAQYFRDKMNIAFNKNEA